MKPAAESLSAALGHIQEADVQLLGKPGSGEAMSCLRFAALGLVFLPENWQPTVRAVLKNVQDAESALLGKSGMSPALAALRRAITALQAALNEGSTPNES
jgi:hypothetical protein